MASSQKSKGKGEMVSQPLHKPGSESVKVIKGGFKSTHCRSETFTVRSRSFKMTVIYCQQNPETRYFLEFYRLKYPNIGVIYSSICVTTLDGFGLPLNIAMGDWSDADMQRALRESMESNSMRVGTPLSSQVPATLETPVVGWEGVIKICGLSLR